MTEENTEKTKLFDPFSNMSFDYDKCFLCGNMLGDENSAEHIIPKWLQHKYDLWNKKIVLLNQTEIPYKQLTIPCCKSCNNESLGQVEKEIQTASNTGFQQFNTLDSLRIFQWVGKIYYGLLFKELSLNADRRNPAQGKITTPDLLERYKTLHMLLQSVRRPFEFSGSLPWSIFVVEMLEFGDNRDFDYADNFYALTFAIRFGEIGIIAHLQDNGIHQEILQEYYNQFSGIKLHPIQFNELIARATYHSLLMNRTPKYISILPDNDQEPARIISMPLQGMSDKPIFDEWVPEVYARYLEFYLRGFNVSFDQLYDNQHQRVMTWLKHDNGSIKQFDTNFKVIR